MSQPPIDLMPASIRARSQAGVVIGRYVASLLLALVLLLVPATHSRFLLDAAEKDRAAARECERLVQQAGRRITELRRELESRQHKKDRYEELALPLDVSRVVATLVNEMPESAALDRLDLRVAGRQAARRSGRARAREGGAALRLLEGEMGGFASSDREIADFVANLERLALCQQVTLDFTRTRTVNDRPAREFRISFRVDLDRRYEVEPRLYGADARRAEGGADVQ